VIRKLVPERLRVDDAVAEHVQRARDLLDVEVLAFDQRSVARGATRVPRAVA